MNVTLSTARDALASLKKYEQMKKCAKKVEKGCKAYYSSYSFSFLFSTAENAKKFLQKIAKWDCCKEVTVSEGADYRSGDISGSSKPRKQWFKVYCEPNTPETEDSMNSIANFMAAVGAKSYHTIPKGNKMPCNTKKKKRANGQFAAINEHSARQGPEELTVFYPATKSCGIIGKEATTKTKHTGDQSSKGRKK